MAKKKIAEMTLGEAHDGLWALRLKYEAACDSVRTRGAGYRRASYWRNRAKYEARIEELRAAEAAERSVA